MKQNRTKANKMPENIEFSEQELSFIAARFLSKSDKEAAGKIGLKGATVSGWASKKAINEHIKAARLDVAKAVIDIYRLHGPKAAMVQAKLLNSDDESVRFKASQEITRQLVGSPKQQQEHTGADSGPILYEVKLPDAD
jgi:hypothetical protein